jgi:sugar lactone lactonase YvrE
VVGPEVVLRTIGVPNNAPGQFHRIAGTGSDSNGALYVADSNHRIVKLGEGGRYLGVIPLEDWPSCIDVSDAGQLVVVTVAGIIRMQPRGAVLWRIDAPWDSGGDVLYSVTDVSLDGFGRVAAVTEKALYRFDESGRQMARIPSVGQLIGVALQENGVAHALEWSGREFKRLVYSPGNALLRSDQVPCSGANCPYSAIGVGGDGSVAIIGDNILTWLNPDGTRESYPIDVSYPRDIEVLPGRRVFIGTLGYVSLRSETGRELWRLGDRSAPGLFRNPTGIGANQQGDLAVADNGNGRVQIFGSGGTLKRIVTGIGGPQVAIDDYGKVMSQIGNRLAVVSEAGTSYIDLYSAEEGFRLVQDVVAYESDIIVSLDDGNAAPSGGEIVWISGEAAKRFNVGGRFEAVEGLALEPDGSLIVALRPISMSASYLVRVSPQGDQERIDLDLPSVWGVAADPSGNLYVSSEGAVHRLASDGTVEETYALPDEKANCTCLRVSGTTLYALDSALEAIYVYEIP